MEANGNQNYLVINISSKHIVWSTEESQTWESVNEEFSIFGQTIIYKYCSNNFWLNSKWI